MITPSVETPGEGKKGLPSWSERYLVNIAEFDDQHRDMFGYLRQIIEAIEEEEKADVALYLLDALAEATVYHFDREEEMMRNLDYPDYTLHAEEHLFLLKELHEFRKRLAQRGGPLREGDLDFLLDWLEVHILGADMRYSGFFNTHGVK
ncbi:MAG: hemerythrin family protein [Nitrospinae bacterium]|nr:hemerythrin family protein [Nitrospinota bacterium]